MARPVSATSSSTHDGSPLATLSVPPDNRHATPCHPAREDPDCPCALRWKQPVVVPELQQLQRPITPNRHRHACTYHPEEDELRSPWRTTARHGTASGKGPGTFSTSTRPSFVLPTAGNPSPASYHPTLPAHGRPPGTLSCSGVASPPGAHSPKAVTGPHATCGPPPAARVPARVANLNTSKVVLNAGSTVLHVELTIKWTLDLQRDLEALSLQSPLLETLHISVTEPDDARWELQCPVLDLSSEHAPRLPSLTQLSVHAVPIPNLQFSGGPMPKLRHLKVSNAGHHLRRPAHASVHVGSFETLEALEVVEVATRSPVDLGQLAGCSPRLRVLHLSEFWGVGPAQAQPAHHRLLLPSCRVLVVKDSLSPMSLDLWAPKLRELQLRVLRLKHLSLGPGGAKHRNKHKPAKTGQPALPAATVVLLPGVLPEGIVEGLGAHTQVKRVQFDEEALAVMVALRADIKTALETPLPAQQPEPGEPGGSPRAAAHSQACSCSGAAQEDVEEEEEEGEDEDEEELDVEGEGEGELQQEEEDGRGAAREGDAPLRSAVSVSAWASGEQRAAAPEGAADGTADVDHHPAL